MCCLTPPLCEWPAAGHGARVLQNSTVLQAGGGRRRSGQRANRQKERKLIPGLFCFCSQNVSWQQKAPFVMKSAFTSASHQTLLLTGSETTACPCVLLLYTAENEQQLIVKHITLSICIAQHHFLSACIHASSSSLSRYDLPQYGSRRKLISPSGLFDEYGEVVVDDDGSYYYSPQESDGEVSSENEEQIITNKGWTQHPGERRDIYSDCVLYSLKDRM